MGAKPKHASAVDLLTASANVTWPTYDPAVSDNFLCTLSTPMFPRYRSGIFMIRRVKSIVAKPRYLPVINLGEHL